VGGDDSPRGYFEQVAKFSAFKPTIHFVILTQMAKVPPNELALVAFSVHSTGVDQVLVRKEWYHSWFALSSPAVVIYRRVWVGQGAGA
jgi:hypothetical protein